MDYLCSLEQTAAPSQGQGAGTLAGSNHPALHHHPAHIITTIITNISITIDSTSVIIYILASEV